MDMDRGKSIIPYPSIHSTTFLIILSFTCVSFVKQLMCSKVISIEKVEGHYLAFVFVYHHDLHILHYHHHHHHHLFNLLFLFVCFRIHSIHIIILATKRNQVSNLPLLLLIMLSFTNF